MARKSNSTEGKVLSENPNRSIFIDFLDPLFAVAIGIGFQDGILKEEFVKDWKLPANDDAFNLLVFILGLFFVSLSWFGYHSSIKSKPIEGNIRFVLDIALVVLYIVLLFKFKDFGAFLTTLATIYSLFIIWDVFKVLEHPEKYSSNDNFIIRYIREIITAY
jgi:hypothetical protein